MATVVRVRKVRDWKVTKVRRRRRRVRVEVGRRIIEESKRGIYVC